MYPEDKLKGLWDIIINIILLIVCFKTPIDIAFSSVQSKIYDNPLSIIIDVCFLLDIILVFNSAFYNNEYDLIESRSKIAL